MIKYKIKEYLESQNIDYLELIRKKVVSKSTWYRYYNNPRNGLTLNATKRICNCCGTLLSEVIDFYPGQEDKNRLNEALRLLHDWLEDVGCLIVYDRDNFAICRLISVYDVLFKAIDDVEERVRLYDNYNSLHELEYIKELYIENYYALYRLLNIRIYHSETINEACFCGLSDEDIINNTYYIFNKYINFLLKYINYLAVIKEEEPYNWIY